MPKYIELSAQTDISLSELFGVKKEEPRKEPGKEPDKNKEER